jgi:hypothetical protein
MSKHTPGPWTFDRETWTIKTNTATNNNLIGDYQGCIVADFGGAHRYRKYAFAECVANALLIASAPDMLRLLKRAIETAPHDLQYEIDEIIKKAEGLEQV